MPLPTLGTALIEVLDALNPIVGPGVLDLTPNQVTIHCVVYAGGKVGADGAVAEAAGYPLVLAQQYPIRQLTTREISNSGGLYEHGDIIIENIPPAYSDPVTGRSGGYVLTQLSPRATTNGTDVYYEITGTHAGYYKVVELRTDQRLTWSVVLTRTATRPMITTPTVTVTLATVSPSAGTAAGGTTVTLTGTGFTNASSVSFGGSPVASFAVVNDTTMTCVTSASAPSANVGVSVTATGGVFGSKAGAWTYLPAGYVMHLAADVGVSLNGSTIAGITDQSVAGNSVQQPVPIRQPTFVPPGSGGIGNKADIVYGGSHFLYATNTDVITTAASAFMVMRATTLNLNDQPFGKAYTTSEWEFAGAGSGKLNAIIGAGSGNRATSNAAVNDGVARCFSLVWDKNASGGLVTMYVGGVAQTATGTFTSTIGGTDTTAIGAASNQVPSNFLLGFTGNMPEVILYPTALAPAARQVVETYLITKYGL